MNDKGLILLVVLGGMTSVSFITSYIIEPYIKGKRDKSVKLNKIKVTLTVAYSLFFLIFTVLLFLGVFVYRE